MSAAIGWSNRVVGDADGVVTLGTVTGSTAFTALAFDSAYPAVNAISPAPSKVTRVTYQTGGSGTFEFYVEADWSANGNVRVVGVKNIRLPANVVGVRMELRNAAGTTLDTTAQVLAASLVPVPGTSDRYDLWWLLAADRSAAKLRLRVQVPVSSTDYVEFGHLWASQAIVWDAVDSGWRLGSVDDSVVARSKGGDVAVYAYPTRARIEIERSVLSYADGLGNSAAPSALSVRQMLREVGVRSPLVVITRSDNSHTLQVATVYGLAQAPLPDITNQPGDYYRTGLVVEEWR